MYSDLRLTKRVTATPGFERKLIAKTTSMAKEWEMVGLTRAFTVAFWILACSLIIMILIFNSVEKILDPSVMVVLLFGLIGMATALHGLLTKTVRRHLTALSRLKDILRKLQADESGCIRRALKCHQTNDLRLRFELGLILSRYELMYAEVVDYMKGGDQSWALE